MSLSAQPPEPASALASQLRAVTGRLKRRLREHGTGHNLTPSQASVLLRLESGGPATVSHLARAEAMRPQSMSAAIAELSAAGYVKGTPDPSDGRKTLISITPAFLKRLQADRAARQDWLTATIAVRLSPREQQTLRTALRLLDRLLED